MAEAACTPFCIGLSCEYRNQHHPLLLALVQSSNSTACYEFEQEVRKLEATGQWYRNDPIPDICPEFNYPIVHWAAVLGKTRILQWCVKKKLNILQTCGNHSETALHRLVLCSYTGLTQPSGGDVCHLFEDIVDLLEVLLDQRNDNQDLPLHLAAKLLVEQGHVNPIVYKIYSKWVEILTHKTNEREKDLLDSCNIDGNTPLHILAQSDKAYELVKILVEYGANIESKNLEGHTAIGIAKVSGSRNIWKLLVNYMKKEQYFLDSTFDDYGQDDLVSCGDDNDNDEEEYLFEQRPEVFIESNWSRIKNIPTGTKPYDDEHVLNKSSQVKRKAETQQTNSMSYKKARVLNQGTRSSINSAVQLCRPKVEITPLNVSQNTKSRLGASQSHKSSSPTLNGYSAGSLKVADKESVIPDDLNNNRENQPSFGNSVSQLSSKRGQRLEDVVKSILERVSECNVDEQLMATDSATEDANSGTTGQKHGKTQVNRHQGLRCTDVGNNEKCGQMQTAAHKELSKSTVLKNKNNQVAQSVVIKSESSHKDPGHLCTAVSPSSNQRRKLSEDGSQSVSAIHHEAQKKTEVGTSLKNIAVPSSKRTDTTTGATSFNQNVGQHTSTQVHEAQKKVQNQDVGTSFSKTIGVDSPISNQNRTKPNAGAPPSNPSAKHGTGGGTFTASHTTIKPSVGSFNRVASSQSGSIDNEAWKKVQQHTAVRTKLRDILLSSSKPSVTKPSGASLNHHNHVHNGQGTISTLSDQTHKNSGQSQAVIGTGLLRDILLSASNPAIINEQNVGSTSSNHVASSQSTASSTHSESHKNDQSQGEVGTGLSRSNTVPLSNHTTELNPGSTGLNYVAGSQSTASTHHVTHKNGQSQGEVGTGLSRSNTVLLSHTTELNPGSTGLNHVAGRQSTITQLKNGGNLRSSEQTFDESNRAQVSNQAGNEETSTQPVVQNGISTKNNTANVTHLAEENNDEANFPEGSAVDEVQLKVQEINTEIANTSALDMLDKFKGLTKLLEKSTKTTMGNIERLNVEMHGASRNEMLQEQEYTLLENRIKRQEESIKRQQEEVEQWRKDAEKYREEMEKARRQKAACQDQINKENAKLQEFNNFFNSLE